MATEELPETSTSPVQTILWIVYAAVPIVAGLDKFLNALTDWSQYLAEPFLGLIPMAPESFMMVVGVIEIAAGILVLFAPRVGGLVVAAWLVAIAFNLVVGGFYDIAVRDLSMAVGAWALSRLSAPALARVTPRVPVYP